MKTIYPYVRFSSVEQQSGDSQRRQMQRVEGYARQNGFVVNDSLNFSDLGLSAYHAMHIQADAGLGRFLAAIESGLIPTDGSSYLCIEQIDRLSRQSIDEAHDLLKRILKANVNIITLMDSKIYTRDSLKSLADIVYSLLLMEQAHQESLKKADRIKNVFSGRLEKIKRGEKVQYAGNIPSWVEKTNESGVFVVNDAKAEIVREIFRRKARDESLKRIADDLNARAVGRIRRKNEGSKLWTTGALSNILKSESVYGVLVVRQERRFKLAGGYKKEQIEVARIEDYYPAVIDKAEFLYVRDKLREIVTVKDTGRATSKNLFSGIVYCGHCGERMYYDEDSKKLKSGLKVYRHLKCVSYLHKCFTEGKLEYSNFESKFPWEHIQNYEHGGERTRGKIQALELERTGLEKQLSLQREKLNALTSEYEKNFEDYDASIFLKLSSELARKISSLEKEQDSLTSQITFFANTEGSPMEFDLANERDREKAKSQIKKLLAAILVYPQLSMGFLIFKNGDVVSVSQLNRERKTSMKAYSLFASYAKAMKAKLEGGQGDAKLKKIFDAFKHWPD